MEGQQNTGSFGAAIGGVDALKAAMQRRGMDAGIVDQMSASAPGGGSPVAAPVQGSSQVAPSIDQTLQAPPSGGGQPKAQTRSGEMDIALKAMKGVIDTENKIAQASIGLQ